jgi:hypothetical protein
MKLTMADGTKKLADHYLIYVCKGGFAEEEFIGVSRNVERHQWMPRPATVTVAGTELSNDLLRRKDLDDLEDYDVRTLLYHVSVWYKQCDVADATTRFLINGFYTWLAEEKPTLETIAADPDHASFALYLL